jgi:hypothetical protein
MQTQLLADIECLGHRFGELHWPKLLAPLRDFYRSVRDGRPTGASWNEAHVEWWMKVLQLHRESFPVCAPSHACPACAGAGGNLKRTRAALEDRYVFVCDCGCQWVELM